MCDFVMFLWVDVVIFGFLWSMRCFWYLSCMCSVVTNVHFYARTFDHFRPLKSCIFNLLVLLLDKLFVYVSFLCDDSCTTIGVFCVVLISRFFYLINYFEFFSFDNYFNTGYFMESVINLFHLLFGYGVGEVILYSECLNECLVFHLLLMITFRLNFE